MERSDDLIEEIHNPPSAQTPEDQNVEHSVAGYDESRETISQDRGHSTSVFPDSTTSGTSSQCSSESINGSQHSVPSSESTDNRQSAVGKQNIVQDPLSSHEGRQASGVQGEQSTSGQQLAAAEDSNGDSGSERDENANPLEFESMAELREQRVNMTLPKVLLEVAFAAVACGIVGLAIYGIVEFFIYVLSDRNGTEMSVLSDEMTEATQTENAMLDN